MYKTLMRLSLKISTHSACSYVFVNSIVVKISTRPVMILQHEGLIMASGQVDFSSPAKGMSRLV